MVLFFEGRQVIYGMRHNSEVERNAPLASATAELSVLVRESAGADENDLMVLLFSAMMESTRGENMDVSASLA